MQFVLIVSLLAAAGIVVVALRWPNRRRQMLFGALFSLPIVGLEILSAGRFDRLGANVPGSIEYLLLTIVAVMGLGGLAAVVADVTINRWLSPTIHQQRHTLGWLAVGLGMTVLLHLFGVSLGLALLLGLLINAILILVLDRKLLWDALVGAAAFGVWYVLADVLFGIRSSGDIQGLLFGSSPIGLTLFGLPLERVLIGLMAGALLGPLFTATKKLRATGQLLTTDVPHAKIVLGLVITVAGFLALASVSYAYVLPPATEAVQPSNGTTVDTTTSEVALDFSRPVDRGEINISIEPNIDGSWQFEQPSFSDHGFRRARFVFSTALQPGTTYQGTVTGITSVWGLAGTDVPFQFTTPPAVVPPAPSPTPVVPAPEPPAPEPVPTPTPTPVPAPTATPPATTSKHVLSISQDYQDSPLSCEAAALKMALAGVGVKVTERQIMDIVGYDPTPHVGDVWGDPNVAFVGNIAGKQNTTGYGVHWDPIARAARHWHSAEVLRNGTPEQVAAAIWAGHPVVIWGTLGRAYPDSWKTPAGKTIAAWKGEHARTVVGVNGTAEHPTSFIINDPVVGRVTWSRSTLNANWGAFSHNAVVLQ